MTGCRLEPASIHVQRALKVTLHLFLFLACVPPGFATPGQATGQQQKAEELFAQAVELHQSGDLEGAISAYQEFLRAHPESVPGRSNLGAVFARLGRYGEAIEQYRQALARGTANPAISFNLGLAYHKSAQFLEAAKELASVLAVQPDNKNAALVLADCHLQLGENKKVIELLEPFQAPHTDDPGLLYLLGTALVRDNQLSKGEALVDHILRQGDSAEAHILMANARLIRLDFEGATREFERALELNPKLPTVHSDYGWALLRLGDRNRARKAFREELEINPNDFRSNLYLGVRLREEQKFEEALGYLQRALEIRPDAPDVRFQIGSLYVGSRKWTEAQRVLEELVKDEPSFVEAHVSLATVYYRLNRKADGDRERAIIQKLNAEGQARAAAGAEKQSQVRRAQTLPEVVGEEQVPQTQAQLPTEAPVPTPLPPVAPASGEVGAADEQSEAFDDLAKRAHQAREAKRTGEAIKLYQAALKKRPSWGEGWWYLGLVYYAADMYADARDAFRRQVALIPEAGGAAWALLGMCEFHTREYERALEHLQRGRRLGLGGNKQLQRVVRYRTALLLTRMERFEAATRILNRLASERGDHPALVEALGLSTLGLPYIPTEVPPDKRDLVLIAGRAAVYAATQRLEDAEREFKDLLARYPRTPGVHYSYGVFLFGENPDAALEEFKRELEISPSSVRTLLQIAFEYINRTEHAAGLPFAEKAVHLKPNEFAARNGLGRILLETGDIEGAIRELEEGVRLAADSPEMRYALARAYARAGRKDDAARERAEFARLEKLRREIRGEPTGLPGTASERRPPT
jgi:tetratricopeptide (TPR) repeat protein